MIYKFIGYQSPFKLEAKQSFVNCRNMGDVFKAKYCHTKFFPMHPRLSKMIKSTGSRFHGATFHFPVMDNASRT